MQEEFYEYLAELIKMHRKYAGLNRNELAQLAGVGKTAVYDIENAKQTMRLNTVMKLLEVLNIKIELNSKLLKDKKLNHAYSKSNL